MKIQKQGFNECQLATIAMLANRPLSEVREVACKMLGTSTWLPLSVTIEIYWLTVEALCIYFGLAEIHPKMNQATANNTTPNLSGKGQITIQWDNEGVRSSAHAMAFEDGLVYDPNGDKPVTWEEWLVGIAERYLDMHVLAIVVSRIDQVKHS